MRPRFGWTIRSLLVLLGLLSLIPSTVWADNAILGGNTGDQVSFLSQRGGPDVNPAGDLQRSGFAAMDALLRTETYQRLTLDQAIKRAVPASKDNTAQYQAETRRLLNLPGSTNMSDLTPQQMTLLEGYIIPKLEGYLAGERTGTTARIGYSNTELLQELILNSWGAEDYWKEFWLLRLLQDPRQWELLW
jgi:hypothetical protein